MPVVFLQAVDECNTIDAEARRRLLSVPNMHKTGNIHGVLPAHLGMEVRFTVKLNATLGLVQEQKATIVGFLFHDDDKARYDECAPGQLFRPRYLPAGIWLRVHGFEESPISQEARELLQRDEHEGESEKEKAARAQSLLLYRPVTEEFTWQSSDTHTVRRTGFPLTHAYYLTSTASQGQTLHKGTTIDCAREEIAGKRGTSDDNWWLNLYVMFSRVTCMSHMLLLRPPSREFLERGPPAALRKALDQFKDKTAASMRRAESLAAELGFKLPHS